MTIYEMASTEAVRMHRSLAQQIEHGASIGQALEASGDLVTVRSAAIAHVRTRDHDRACRGKLEASELAFLPASWARKAKAVFPEDAFAEYDE